MARRRLSANAFLLACLVCVAGACTPYTYYTIPNSEYDTLSAADRTRVRRSIRPCTDLTDQASNAALSEQCTLSVIEFDDQGDFWKPQQLDETLELIGRKSHRDGGEALVVVFVHGWKNNASLDNELNKNLGSFKKVLMRLAQEELRPNEDGEVRGRAVIGVYMSWHGLSNTTPLLKQISFFARKNAATRVARVSFSHAIQRVVARTKGTLSETAGNPRSIAVVVGHSFGGLIVENTLLRTLTVETNDFEAYGADLTVLVNPANEAILARQSVHALHGAPPRKLSLDGQEISRPLIVSVTSVADAATGTIFPLALRLKGIFKNFRKYERRERGLQRQRTYYTHTPGHVEAEAGLRSHQLTCPLEPGGVCEAAPKTAEGYERAMAELQAEVAAGSRQTIFPPPAVELGDCLRQVETDDGVVCIDRLSFMGAATGQVYTVERNTASPNQTGYWIMPIPATIVPDHSDIFQSELESLLAAFINLRLAHVVDSLDGAESYLEAAYPGD